jgi:cyclophilin family peptidyl-prolyl cis-trans isomerase
VALKAQINVQHNEPLTLFLALEREVSGRRPWELCLLPRPHTPQVGLFATGLRMLRDNGLTELPAQVAIAPDVPSLTASLMRGDPGLAGAWDLIGRSLTAVQSELSSAITAFSPRVDQAVAEVERTLLPDHRRCAKVLSTALGVGEADRPLPIYLVPFAPFPPGVAFLTERGRPVAGYLDYRRYSGASMLECALTLLSWYLLRTSPGDGSLSQVVAAGSQGSHRATRRLRAVVLKLLVAMTAAHLVSEYHPEFPGTIAASGLDLRYPRLLSAIQAPWLHFLHGRTSRERALAVVNDRLAAQPAAWFTGQVDAASLAADFYLLEWLTAQGDADAVARLASWQPRLAAGFARHLDFAIGAELVHYDGIPLASPLAPQTIAFIQETCAENAMLRWPDVRRGGGSAAYRLAETTFTGPGAEYGGEAWAPVAHLMAQYCDGTIGDRLFIDQCFTLEHNNGCLFDKFYDTWDMPATLAAQAEGDVTELSKHASAEVRGLLAGYQARPGASPLAAAATRPASTPSAATRPAAQGFHAWPLPGRAGSGSSADPSSAAAVYRGKVRKAHRHPVPDLRWATAVLHTDVGPITLSLDPRSAPLAVGTFVQLARGHMPWRDPVTGGAGSGPFYDGTRFHRVVPGFLLQAGDRTETGRGGPGFRYDEEPSSRGFDAPFLVAMVNTGTVTNGSQFFITLTAAPHLDDQYTIFGEVPDDGSREAAWRVSEAEKAGRPEVRIERVEVDAG